MQTNRTIEQARKLKTRDFRNEKYLNSYLQHCDAGYVTPRQFEVLVEGKGTNVFPMRRILEPEMEMQDYFDIVICQVKGEKKDGKTNKT